MEFLKGNNIYSYMICGFMNKIFKKEISLSPAASQEIF